MRGGTWPCSGSEAFTVAVCLSLLLLSGCRTAVVGGEEMLEYRKQGKQPRPSTTQAEAVRARRTVKSTDPGGFGSFRIYENMSEI